jgi:hypothetical protein
MDKIIRAFINIAFREIKNTWIINFNTIMFDN